MFTRDCAEASTSRGGIHVNDDELGCELSDSTNLLRGSMRTSVSLTSSVLSACSATESGGSAAFTGGGTQVKSSTKFCINRVVRLRIKISIKKDIFKLEIDKNLG